MKKIFLLIFAILLNTDLAFSSDTNLVKLNNIKELKEYKTIEKKGLLIYSSRYYIDDIRNIQDKDVEIYWVLPFPTIEEEALNGLKELLKGMGREIRINQTSEGIVIEEVGRAKYIILPYTEMSKIVFDEVDLILDVDFFFRMYLASIARVNNEKTLEVIKFYRSLEEYGLIPENLYLIMSRDISLPEWVEEFGYIIEKVYYFWKDKKYPASLILLDEVGKYITFAQYEDAYQILLDIFPEEMENPYFYEKMMIVASKMFFFDDMLKAFDEGYKRQSYIINLVPEIANYLLEKEEFYPAYLLVKKASEKELWNKEINSLLNHIIVSGYNFYNKLNEDDELFKFFREEYQRLKSKAK